MLEVCPVCGRGFPAGTLPEHLLWTCLPETSAPAWAEFGYRSCWCLVDYPRDAWGLREFTSHLELHGGVTAHFLAHGLGVQGE